MRANRITRRRGGTGGRGTAERLESRVFLTAAAAAPAVPTGQMIADLNLAPAGSAPRNFTAVGDTMFFAADDGVHGTELWATDGTTAGTRLVKDIDPRAPKLYDRATPEHGLEEGHSSPSGLTAFKGALYFFADDGVHGRELWRSDGTEAGTVLVKDTNFGKYSGVAAAAAAQTAVLGEALYFVANGKLWKSNGTTAGTVQFGLLADGPLAVAGGRLYFIGYDDAHGRELWRTDGTPAGTGLVRDLSPGTLDSYFYDAFAPAGDYLYFRARVQPAPYEYHYVVYRTDGTEQGTVALGESATVPVVAGGRAFFSEAGALQVSDPANGTRPLWTGEVTSLTAAGDRAFFVGYDQPTGYELWTSDGTAAGTRLVKDLAPGVLSGMPLPAYTDDPIPLAALGGSVVFTGADGHLYRSDGTADGTVRLSTASMTRQSGDLATRTDLHAPFAAAMGGRLFFNGWDPDHGEELWVTDGTAAGTALVADLNAGTRRDALSVMSDPEGPVFSGGSFYFTANGGRDGGGLWRTDGTAAGTARLSPQPATQLIDFDGDVYFRGYDPATGGELWRSDGTPEGTGLLKELAPGHASGLDFGGSQIPEAPHTFLNEAVYRGALYVGTVYGGDGSAGLWRTDGTEAGTVRLDPPDRLGDFMAVANGVLYFQGHDAAHGYELWASDGTAEGARLLADLIPGPDSRDIAFMGSAGGVAFFYSPALKALVRSDGTPEGTFRVAQTRQSIGPSDFLTIGNTAFFADTLNPPDYSPAVWQLWRSDGTAAGTQPLNNLPGFPGWFVGSAGDALFYLAGSELWRTDGTAAGTYRVRAGVKAAVGPYGNTTYQTIQQSATVSGRLYFIARHDDPAEPAATRSLGSELWVTDGTEEGTYPVPGFAAAPAASIANQPIAVGDNQLMVMADDGMHGTNPWLVNLPAEAPAPAVTKRRAFYNHSAFDGGDPAATDADLNALAPDKVALRPGQAAAAASFANVTSYAKGLNGVLIEFAGQPHGELTAADFQFQVSRVPGLAASWSPGPAPAQVVRLSTPAGAARYAITWADGAIRNAWLRVTVKADANTGLAAPDVFYFGNLAGDAGGADLRVTTVDYADVIKNVGRAAPANSPFDFDRDGRVTTADLLTTRANLYGALATFTAAAPPAPAPTFASARIVDAAKSTPSLVQRLGDDRDPVREV